MKNTDEKFKSLLSNGWNIELSHFILRKNGNYDDPEMRFVWKAVRPHFSHKDFKESKEEGFKTPLGCIRDLCKKL